MVKSFTIFFYKGFYGQWKIFYKFDHILHANKHRKLGKHFLENILLQNKRSIRDENRYEKITFFNSLGMKNNFFGKV